MVAISSPSHPQRHYEEAIKLETMILLAAGIGIFIGLVVGALGAGGGILSIPVLVYLLSQSPHAAAAESLIIVGLTSFVALLTRREQVRWREGLSFGFLTLLGAVAGARLNLLISSQILLYSFSLLLIVIAIVMLRRAQTMRRTEKTEKLEKTTPAAKNSKSAPATANRPAPRRPLYIVFLAATGTGLLTGFFGIGGGVVVVPILIFSLGFPMPTATATSLLVMVITSALGLAGRLGTNLSLDIPLTLIFAAGSMLGGIFGGRITKSLRDSTLTYSFSALLFTISVFIFVSTTLQLS